MKAQPKFLSLVMIGAVILVTGCGRQQTTTFQSLTDQNTSVQLKSFVTEKGAQANAATNKMRPEFRKFFAAAQRGDWLTVSNMFRDLGSRNGQFERAANPDFDLRGTQWEAAKEIWGVFGGVFVGDERRVFAPCVRFRHAGRRMS